MKTYAPGYYKSFKCKAARCRHSCCIGWEIDVDGDTLDYYESIDAPIGEKLRNSVLYRDGIASFAMSDGERCPFLMNNGLCELICELGEESLSDICREHPRFYNYMKDREEVGLGLSCEAAAELILYSDESFEPVLICEDCEPSASDGFADALAARDAVLSMLSDSHSPIEKLLSDIEARFGVYDTSTVTERADMLLSLEIMTPEWKEILIRAKTSEEKEYVGGLPYNRIAAYFAYRHVSAARSADELEGAIGFVLFCTRAFADICRSESTYAQGTLSRERAVELACLFSSEIEYSEENTELIKARFIRNGEEND